MNMEKSPLTGNSSYSDILSAIGAREASAETIRYLQNKIDASAQDYRLALKEKNDVIKDLKSQLASMNEHLAMIKARYDEASEAILQEQLLSKVKVEEADKVLKEQKIRHQKELKLISELLERSKFEISSLSSKLESERKEKNELKEKIKSLEIQKAELADKTALLENTSSQNKKAVEETLGALFEERKKTSDFSKKINELENKISSLNRELENTRLNWDAERKEWRELWERERSVWETHRQEFAVWEERLRSEREAWLERLKKEEERGVDYAQNIAKILEDTSKWSDKVTQILKLYASKGVQLPQVFISAETVKKKMSSGLRKTLIFALASFVLLSAGLWTAYDYSLKLRLKPVYSLNLDSGQYTALAFDGNKRIFATWSDGLIFTDKEGKTINRISDFGGQRLKISAMALSNGHIWALDLAQLRFAKIDPESGKIISSVKTAGPVPQGLAFDGFNLWSFDAATGLLYKYSPNSDINGVITYNLPGLKSAEALVWKENELYACSQGEIIRYSFKNDSFSKITKQKMKNIVSFYIDKAEMAALKTDGKSAKADFYSIKNFSEEK
ncbi:MAG: hypothetical protein GX447_07140 [Elusimicrobia bacterium]|nr:hypothetical protein [Elusimicrobiota bacterium]